MGHHLLPNGSKLFECDVTNFVQDGTAIIAENDDVGGRVVSQGNNPEGIIR